MMTSSSSSSSSITATKQHHHHNCFKDIVTNNTVNNNRHHYYYHFSVALFREKFLISFIVLLAKTPMSRMNRRSFNPTPTFNTHHDIDFINPISRTGTGTVSLYTSGQALERGNSRVCGRSLHVSSGYS